MSKPDIPYMRKIRSFVKREGRLTPGQDKALQALWPKYGHSIKEGPISCPKPTVLEIGFGNGHSLVSMAAADPETHFIGIEVHRPGVGALLLIMQAQEVSNISVYQEDAVEVLQSCIADESLTRVQLFFPDPWPKKKHHKRRIVQTEFIDCVHQKLIPGGVFHLATDWQPYAKWMMAAMQASTGWKNQAGDGQFSPRPSYRPETKFEVRGKKLGHDVFDLLFEKINTH